MYFSTMTPLHDAFADVSSIKRHQRVNNCRLSITSEYRTAKPGELAARHANLKSIPKWNAWRALRIQLLILSLKTLKVISTWLLPPSGLTLSTGFWKEYGEQLVRSTILSKLNKFPCYVGVYPGHGVAVKNAQQIFCRDNK